MKDLLWKDPITFKLECSKETTNLDRETANPLEHGLERKLEWERDKGNLKDP